MVPRAIFSGHGLNIQYTQELQRREKYKTESPPSVTSLFTKELSHIKLQKNKPAPTSIQYTSTFTKEHRPQTVFSSRCQYPPNQSSCVHSGPPPTHALHCPDQNGHFKIGNLILLQPPTLPLHLKPSIFFPLCLAGPVRPAGVSSASPPHFVPQPHWPCCAPPCHMVFAHTVGWNTWFNAISSFI